MSPRNELNQKARGLLSQALRRQGCQVMDPGSGDMEVWDSTRLWRLTVRSVRNRNYAFVQKSQWPRLDGQLLGFVTFDTQGMNPQVYIIPALAWKEAGPNLRQVLKERNYDKPGQKSAPEWGIDHRHELLTPYLIDSVLPVGIGTFVFPDPASI